MTLQSDSVLNLEDGKLSSTGGTLSLQQGLTLGSGAIFDFSGSTAEFSGTLNVGDGTISSSSSSTLELQTASSFSSNAVFHYSNTGLELSRTDLEHFFNSSDVE